MKTIKITVDPSVPTVPFRSLKPFQHDSKELTNENCEKLKSRILSVGFCSPVCVWKNGETLNILDGHQRISALSGLEADGYKIPPIPIVEIQAESEHKAQEILLSMISQYGDINKDSDWLKNLVDSFDSSIRDTFVFRDHVLEFDVDLGFDLPEPEEQPEEKPKTCCPECGFEF